MQPYYATFCSLVLLPYTDPEEIITSVVNPASLNPDPDPAFQVRVLMSNTAEKIST
jgi:hypothetical protein